MGIFLAIMLYNRPGRFHPAVRGNEMLLADTLKKAYQLFPRKEAIVCGGRRWTYG